MNDSKSNGLSLADFQGAAQDDERRKESRVAVAKSISILLCDRGLNSGHRQVQVVDCSPHGLGIISYDPINPGERFIAELQLERKLLVIYTARHCRLHGGTYQVGAALTGFLGGLLDDPKQILDALTAKAGGKK